jgi:hypothetical protein
VGAFVAFIAVGILAWTYLKKPGAAVRVVVVPACSDPAYLSDVQGIVKFNGLKEVRSGGELSSTDSQRHCRLLANDADGKEVRLRGSLVRVGADVQLSIQPE